MTPHLTLAALNGWRVSALTLSLTLIISALYIWRPTTAQINNNNISLTGSVTGSAEVQLNWRVVGSISVTSFRVMRALSTAPQSFQLLTTLPTNITNYKDTTVSPGTAYHYVIRGVLAGSSLITIPSNTLTLTISGTPTPTPTPTPTTTPTPTPTPTPVATPTPSPTPVATPPSAPTSGIFVAPNGSSRNPGSLQSPIDLATALAGNSPARPGDTIWLRGGVYSVPGAPLSGTENCAYACFLNGTSVLPITIRAYPGERVTIHGGIRVEGSYTVFRDFEITNPNTDRTRERPKGMNVLGHHIKIINMVIHNNGDGIAFWAPAVDSEIYGTVLYRNGWEGEARGNGHGIYSQNRDGTKQILDCVSFDNYATGMKGFAESGYVIGYKFEGNISFNNGSPARPREEFDRQPNILVGAAINPSDRIEILNNYTYHPLNSRGASLGLGYIANPNGRTIVQGNYLVSGNAVTAYLKYWKNLSFTDNTVIGNDQIISVHPPANTVWNVYQWDNNRYFSNAPNPWDTPGRVYSFSNWKQASSLDQNSQFGSSRPTGVKVFVRPNRYESGRANIAVYNWDLQNQVSVDVSGVLQPGARYEIRNPQDFYGVPILSGTYNGQPLNLPMTGLTTSPEFNAFVLITTTTTSAPPANPTPTPTPTPPPNSATDIPLEDEERRLLELINQYRLQRGRSPLGASISLTKASDFLAREMATANYTDTIDLAGRGPAERAHDFGFEGGAAPIPEDALVSDVSNSAQDVFMVWRSSTIGKTLLLTPEWKVAGVGRAFNAATNRWHWNVTFAAYWDATIRLAGEDQEGRIDGNELIRTRPPSNSLLENHSFSGYGEDGFPYSSVHCDVDVTPRVCWRDPPPQTNSRLAETSTAENFIGLWKVMYTINSIGVVHAEYDGWDRTGYAMELQINPGGTWTMRGYRSGTGAPATESGTWNLTHIANRNEEVINFIRAGTLPRATIRAHVVAGQLTLFAIDGGGSMKNFLRGVTGDDNNRDDPQVIFVPKQ
ncbi:MAG: hypothetical protein SF097_08290 [Acidobacteriota bacterium]|nr:hypothetical protein [Acidobacteriota bacterium]